VDVQIEHVAERHVALLTIKLDPAQTDPAKQKAAKRLAQKVRIPGFRPNKVPYSMVVKSVGEQAILEEAAEDIANTVYNQALDQSQVEAAAMGQIVSITEVDGQVNLVLEVPKAPEIDLKDYRKVRGELVVQPVTDETLKLAMDTLLEQHAVVETVQRPLKIGDEFLGDLRITWWHAESATEENPKPTGGHEHTLFNMENDTFILRDDPKRDLFPGFSQTLVGLSAGDEKEYPFTLPDDLDDEHVRGQTAQVKVKVTAVHSRTQPILNDDFAARASDGKFPSLLELRMDMRQKLEENSQAEARRQLFGKLLTDILQQTETRYHRSLLQQRTLKALEALNQDLLQNANMSLNDYLKVTGRSFEEVANNTMYRVMQDLHSELVFMEILRREGISVSEEAIEAEIDKAVQRFGDDEQSQIFRDMMRQNPETRGEIATKLLQEALVERIIQIGLGQAPDLPTPSPSVGTPPSPDAEPVETVSKPD